ncbi:MAG: VTT domain-containing protein [Deltaproteobacteria bacterium]|nr:VTT domain-containing protein [Deltaproteobacteria bacterium]
MIDADAYFSAFASAVERARHSVLIAGWDIDSRVRLRRNDSKSPFPDDLSGFLNAVLARRPGLRVYILSWDFAMIYLLEREFLPVFKLDWRSHRRLRFRLDGVHPPGASHHQKIVVIDDAMAFSGGLDLTSHRWDTPEHRLGDPRRADPGGILYPPFHDIQIAVDGEAAAHLGELVRERWRRATGQAIPRLGPGGEGWPPELRPDLKDVKVTIARTQPAWKGQEEVREVERLFLDMIAAARHAIYIENQYQTAPRLAQALADRLKERNGPEMVMVLPLECSGWLEMNTMGALRRHFLQILKEADRHGRLHLYVPLLQDRKTPVEVHSKVMVVDDHMARVGSANLSNRSLALDTECDLMIEAGGEERVSKAIARFRNRLLGEHLGAAPEEVEQAIAARGSLGEAIAGLLGRERTLEPLRIAGGLLSGHLCSETELCDPERPMSAEMILEYMLPEEARQPARGRLLRLMAILVLIGGLAAVWYSTPIREVIGPSRLLAMAQLIWAAPLAGLMLVLLAYVIGGLIFFPLTVLQLMTILIFDPLPGFLYALLGTMVSAVLSFKIGQILGREVVRRLAGRMANRISLRLARHGLMTVAFLRLMPIAPFTVVNFVVGVSHIRFREYFWGTLVGVAPGLFLLAIFGDRLAAAVRDPNSWTLAILGLLILFSIGSVYWLYRRLGASGAGTGGGKREGR